MEGNNCLIKCFWENEIFAKEMRNRLTNIVDKLDNMFDEEILNCSLVRLSCGEYLESFELALLTSLLDVVAVVLGVGEYIANNTDAKIQRYDEYNILLYCRNKDAYIKILPRLRTQFLNGLTMANAKFVKMFCSGTHFWRVSEERWNEELNKPCQVKSSLQVAQELQDEEFATLLQEEETRRYQGWNSAYPLRG
jgi:hypothetical protein